MSEERDFNVYDDVAREAAHDYDPPQPDVPDARDLALDEACACGYPRDRCRPEVCSHSFARDALWGSS